MRGNNVLGLIFANAYDEILSGMTAPRAMGSIPFGGGYRLIDFTLSNMVNSGIAKVGVITSTNYQSLMDHIGNGKPWDLARKHDGMFLLPPFSPAGTALYNSGRTGAIKNISHFLQMSDEEYVVMSDCNAILNINLEDVFRFHEEQKADITIVYKHGRVPNLSNLLVFDEIRDSRIVSASCSPEVMQERDFSLNITVLRKSLLESMVNDASARGVASFEKDIIMRLLPLVRVCGYKFKNFCPVIDSLQSYYDANFALLNSENRRQLLYCGRPVYTKVYDEMPAVYGLGSEVKNSLIADGCVIDGDVENSIVFRNCRVAKDAVVRNCVLMSGGSVAEGAMLNCAILDKDVTVRQRRSISGAESYPIYVGKGIKI